jgi:purine nucleosidase
MMTPGVHRVIIDCDPGCDDAVALMLAFASPNEIEILGITTSAGNANATLTQTNARMLCEFGGRPDIGVYAGCERPMVRAVQHADVHGQTGIDGFPSFEPQTAIQGQHAVDFIVATLLDQPDGAVTLACLGPLTNIAMAIIREPGITRKIREIVLMGGARSAGGNITPAATFNIYFDPHAARVVFAAGCPVVAISLDACSQVLCGPEWLGVLRGSGRPIAATIADLIAFYDAVRIRKFGFTTQGAPVNDPCVIAYLVNPDLFGGRYVNVEVEVASELTMGMTVVDFWGVTARVPNVTWVHDVDAPGVLKLLTERISLM